LIGFLIEGPDPRQLAVQGCPQNRSGATIRLLGTTTRGFKPGKEPTTLAPKVAHSAPVAERPPFSCAAHPDDTVAVMPFSRDHEAFCEMGGSVATSSLLEFPAALP